MPNTIWSCLLSQVHTHAHMHTQRHTGMASTLCLQPHSLRKGPCPPCLWTLHAQQQHPPHTPLTSLTTAGCTSGTPKLMWAPQKPQSMGPEPQTDLAFPRKNLCLWGSLGTVAEGDLTGSEKAFGPKSIFPPGLEIPSPTLLRLTAGTGSHLKFWSALSPGATADSWLRAGERWAGQGRVGSLSSVRSHQEGALCPNTH